MSKLQLGITCGDKCVSYGKKRSTQFPQLIHLVMVLLSQERKVGLLVLLSQERKVDL